jgi:hypothetical protein
MFFKKQKMIGLNEYSHEELEANVEYTINTYHDNRFINKIFKVLNKIDSSFLKMREAGLSIEYIRQIIIDYFDYKVGIGTLSEYFKAYHNIVIFFKFNIFL